MLSLTPGVHCPLIFPDTLGLFPQMIIVSLCLFLLLLRISLKTNNGQSVSASIPLASPFKLGLMLVFCRGSNIETAPHAR